LEQGILDAGRDSPVEISPKLGRLVRMICHGFLRTCLVSGMKRNTSI
jgi:hypothetical protein